MKILVIGSGGREHTLVWKIAQSKKVSQIFCAPGNPGTEEFAQNVDIPITDINGLLEFAIKKKIDLTVVGSEAPLIVGIVDLFEKHNKQIIGPRKKAARLEGSKIFAKKVMLWNKIPTAKFACFDDYNLAKIFLKSQKYPLVIKAEGQCLGKGVFICQNEKSAQKAIKAIMVDKMFGTEGKGIVIEEYLKGQEISFMVATDGTDFISLLPSQDHKKVFDGDRGPNTGGMGAYAPVPFIKKEMIERIEKEIIAPTIRALSDHDNPYTGILYPGLILTTEGPKILEYNCRFGDPETQPLMMLLKSDIIDLFMDIANKQVKKTRLIWKKGYSVCTVLTSKGYPGSYKKGEIIKGLDTVEKRDLVVFQAGTKKSGKKIITSGGRVLGITSFGNTLKKAIDRVYKYLDSKELMFSGMHYRKDIGQKGLKSSLWKNII